MLNATEAPQVTQVECLWAVFVFQVAFHWEISSYENSMEFFPPLHVAADTACACHHRHEMLWFFSTMSIIFVAFIVILSAWDLDWLKSKELHFASFLSLWIFIIFINEKRKFFRCTRERWNATLKVARWNVKIYYENVSTLTLWLALTHHHPSLFIFHLFAHSAKQFESTYNSMQIVLEHNQLFTYRTT